MHEINKGESKTYKLTFRNRLTRAVIDVSAALGIYFYLRATRDGTDLVTITDAEMDLTNAAAGYVYLTLTATHTALEGYYYGVSLLSHNVGVTDKEVYNFYIESA